MPIFHSVQQGSEQWLQLRSGVPTSSCFDQILTPKLKPSASAEKYLFKLLAEKIIGHPIIEHVSLWQQRGTQLEADAVRFYEMQVDEDTVPIGFVTNEAETIGASPDRLCGDEGLLEIKVPAEHTTMMFLLNTGSAYEAYRLQTLGQLWITEKKWCDLLAWHPELPPALVRIERDEDAIKQIAAAVTAFSLELERQYALCIQRGWVRKPKAPPPLTPMEEMIKVLKQELTKA